MSKNDEGMKSGGIVQDIIGYLFVFIFIIPVIPFLLLHIYNTVK